ncbi:MAG: FtsH protease activity modulator HflK [Limisphaerales bacterium]|nr:FtsH protease activity modulator HflK [Pedosphaera sp.]RZO71094.1 MAG: FtsH protease activity modulator HflK [Limisphaerales bacterium]HAQ98765.1 FtsH protease activity modulator HflK [Verrucomicrobiales bacterium]HCP36788.1 FtsH protease activity modulator HflK [Verrucomicrobiales bacterium]HCZ03293.1 FtsH protease activity modulator HflK [Verrucomicrobiales bacterium]|tara:strand:- start:1177 stop:2157 length:981 start_codon:yes stop_codon:yes gene_type:complete
MSQIKKVFEANFNDQKSQFRAIIMGLIAVLVVIALLTAFYTVQAESQGVVLRFGKYIKTVEPGLKFKLPFGIETVQIVPVRRQLKQEFGVSTRDATNPYQYTSSSEQNREKSMVTGDLNAASVEWIVQFRVNNPRQFLFQVKEPESTLRAVSESVMREVVGDRTVDEVITVGRQEIEVVALQRMQKLVDNYKMGLSIDQVQLKDVNPPPPVQPSFNEVNQAQQEREQLINQANGEYNKVVPRARGEADQKIRSAEGYALKRVNEAEGDATKFTALFTEFLKAPEVTKRRLHLETMRSIIPKMGKKIILDSDAKQILPLLQIAPVNK